jgi:hypothetical protein
VSDVIGGERFIRRIQQLPQGTSREVDEARELFRPEAPKAFGDIPTRRSSGRSGLIAEVKVSPNLWLPQ